MAEKNPWAVAVGNRIKQARLMADLDTQASLLEKIPEWTPSRLGNYEAGISLPSPGDVMLLAETTQSSPCWIMFGIGPIRASARDVQAIRHQNLLYIFEQSKKNQKLKNLLQALGLSRKKLDDYLNNPFHTVSDRIARRCESYFRKPKNWMDEQHVESDPLCASFPDDIRQLMMIFSELKPEDRSKLLAIAQIFDRANQNN